ncbi:unnamed protein product [Umbelopsis sp. WA50703]
MSQDEPDDNNPKIGDVANSNPFDAAVNHDANDDMGLYPTISHGSVMANVTSSATAFLSSQTSFAPATIPPSTSVTKNVSPQNSPASTLNVDLSMLIPYFIPFILIELVK